LSLHQDLLDQAADLVLKEANRPRQASLRRAISTAYYAVFHLLIFEATKTIVPEKSIGYLVARAFQHNEMKEISKAFYAGAPKKLGTILPTVSSDLKHVAGAFVTLQEARHQADYDTAKRFTRAEANTFIQQAQFIFTTWKTLRKSHEARVYLLALLLNKRWER
jgi:uncharacterized protein (UPF0332 family)